MILVVCMVVELASKLVDFPLLTSGYLLFLLLLSLSLSLFTILPILNFMK